MKTNPQYGIVPCSKTRVRCVLCGVHVPKATRCIEQHSNGTKHLESIRLMSNNAMSFKEEHVHCKACDQNLSIDDWVLNHIEGHDHGNWLAAMEDLTEGEFINLDEYLCLNSENALCEVCNKPVMCSLSSIETHVNSVQHRTNICKHLAPRNGLFMVDNGERVWCKVCNLYLENNPEYVLDHLDNDMDHMQWFMYVEDLIQDQNMSMTEFLTIQKETKAYCNKCNVTVKCNPKSIEAHIHSESHLYRF